MDQELLLYIITLGIFGLLAGWSIEHWRPLFIYFYFYFFFNYDEMSFESLALYPSHLILFCFQSPGLSWWTGR
jgi:hypothetical protein